MIKTINKIIVKKHEKIREIEEKNIAIE